MMLCSESERLLQARTHQETLKRQAMQRQQEAVAADVAGDITDQVLDHLCRQVAEEAVNECRRDDELDSVVETLVEEGKIYAGGFFGTFLASTTYHSPKI